MSAPKAAPERTTPAAAQRLRDAYRKGPIEPLRDVVDPHDAQLAYAIQALNTQHWLDRGRAVCGFKVGLTSRAVQEQLGVDQPDYGVLFEDMLIPNGGTLDIDQLIQPRGEAEVALVLGRRIDQPELTVEELTDAIDHARPAIEVVDSRIADWRITFADTVADNGSSAFYVLGDAQVPLDGLDLYTCGMVYEVDGKPASYGAGAACLGHPLHAATWLARTLVGRGQTLEAGQVILTGALGPMVDLHAGQRVRAVIGGLGEVTLNVGAAS